MSLKRLLLGTSALLGMGLLGVSMPGAATAAEIKPGGALDVSISGFARFRATFGDLDDARLNDTTGEGLDFSNDTEVHVILKGKHDATGIEYGGTVEFEADTNRTDNTDETWIFMRGGFGEVRFGDEDGVTDNSKVTAANIAAGTGGIDGSVIDTIAIGVLGPTNSDDATKIRYYTPSFGGFQAGISYTPNQQFLGSGSGNGDSLAAKDPTPDIQDFIEGGLIYEGEFGGLGFETSAVGGICRALGDDLADDCWTWFAGAATEIFGFKVAGGFGDEDIGGLERTYYNVGAGYGLGPANVSVNFGQVIDEEGYEAGDAYNLVFSADFALMPGLTLAGDVGIFDNDTDGDSLNEGGDKGYQAIIRLDLAF